jgi:hypothetical protein
MVGSLWAVATVRSSANPTVKERKVKQRRSTPSIKTDQRKGDRTPPCEQPRPTFTVREESFREKSAVWSERKLTINWVR